jgi:hypothetical protein
MLALYDLSKDIKMGRTKPIEFGGTGEVTP